MTNKIPNPNDQTMRGCRHWSLVIGHLLVIGVWALGLLSLGCGRAEPAASKAGPITVASLVPAATDVIVNMGAADHLVAVSNWDPKLPEIDALPRAGDYRTVDWEKIAQVKPTDMIVQFAPDKMPAGLADKAREMNIRLINVKINRLDDIFQTIDQLGQAIAEPAKASAASKKLHEQLDAVRQRVSGEPPMRTLMIRSESDLASVGGGNFMDDLLTVAGGKNVLSGGDNSFPTIDREQLMSLNPDAVILLFPGEAPQTVEKAKQFWNRQSDISAVSHGRVYVLTDSYLLLPGLSAGKIAGQFADLLHPPAAKGTP